MTKSRQKETRRFSNEQEELQRITVTMLKLTRLTLNKTTAPSDGSNHIIFLNLPVAHMQFCGVYVMQRVRGVNIMHALFPKINK